MSTTIRPELSEKNKYHIPKHRYYELKHFCLQYPEWYKAIVTAIRYPDITKRIDSDAAEWSDPVWTAVKNRDIYKRKIDLVEAAAKKTDESLGGYILKAVTEDLSYTCLQMMYNIPCGKDKYYELYRKFFYILDKTS